MQSDIHFIQKEIIKKLISTPHGLRFNELLLDNINSDLFNYHLKVLIKRGLLEKKGIVYALSGKGKEYVNDLDKSNIYTEPMAQTCIIVHGIRINEKDEVEHLLCRRLVQPYYGKISRISGKVRYGEDLVSACKRKLKEKTGLRAENFKLERIYHKIGTDRDGNVLQDVIFYIFFVKGFSGELMKRNEVEDNFWVTSKKVLNNKKDYDLFQDMSISDRREALEEVKISEVRLIVEGF